MRYVTIGELLAEARAEIDFEILAGQDGMQKRVHVPRIQRPGLALTGDLSHVHPGRIQILGKSEMRYLKSLTPEAQLEICDKFCGVDLSGVVITRGQEVLPALAAACDRFSVPLLRTKLVTYILITRVTRFLEHHLTASTDIHGVLMDVFGVGTLLIGKSGIGKSECALDLILRGHRLIADDIVVVKKRPPATLYGAGASLIRHMMEIRGLGILNVCDLFGVTAIGDQKILEVVVELVEWDANEEYDRLGVDEAHYTVLQVPVPYIKIPVRPGRNIASLIEVAARNHLLKRGGHHTAREFAERFNHDLKAQDGIEGEGDQHNEGEE